jgi:hypothetical protein
MWVPMKLKELFDQLHRDMPTCADLEFLVELKSPEGQLIQSTFLADRVVVRRNGRGQYVLRMGWGAVGQQRGQ